jgi:hypothetical protein
MRIWIEVELNSFKWLNESEIAQDNWFSFNSFERYDWLSIPIKMSNEYYQSTIEYNFFPFNPKDNYNLFWEIKDFLGHQMAEYWLGINWMSPAFTGTHIHIFNKYIPKKKLLLWTINFIADNIDKISNVSLVRLLFAHQLWGNYSYKNNDEWFNFIRDYWTLDVNYRNLRSKTKYNPVINSRAIDWWKPKSIEVRIIPNEFMIDWTINEYISQLESWELFNNNKITRVYDFYCILINKIYPYIHPSTFTTYIDNTYSFNSEEVWF